MHQHEKSGRQDLYMTSYANHFDGMQICKAKPVEITHWCYRIVLGRECISLRQALGTPYPRQVYLECVLGKQRGHGQSALLVVEY